MCVKTAFNLTLIFLLSVSLHSYGADSSQSENGINKKTGYLQFLWETSKFYLSNRWKTKEVYESTPSLNSHFEFLSEKRAQNNSGKMTSYFDRELQTRIYYSVTGKPDHNGITPIVDPNSKGLVIYFHGSGTENGSGANFNYKGNKLSTLGYSSVSMDYPFHRDGPINSKYGSAKFYSGYLLSLINKFRLANKPVILVGHSFGVNVIAEFITRYPFAADSVVLLSPAGFNDELAKWSKEKTSLMLKTFPHFTYNELGARWAGFINRQFTWNKLKKREFKDPTLVNPNLKVRIVSGEWEEFIPGPLDENGLPKKVPRTYDVLAAMKAFFSRATTIMEPNVGHLVHSHNDVNGHDLVLREILAANGESIANYKDIVDSVSKERKKILTEIDQGIHKQQLEPFFREWLAGTYGADYIKTISQMNESEGITMIRRVLADFKKFEDWRSAMILTHLQEIHHPFYMENKEQMDLTISAKNLNERTRFVNAYYMYLAQHPEAAKSDVLAINVVQKWVAETNWSLQDRVRVDLPPVVDRKASSKSNYRNQCVSFYKKSG